MQDLKDMKQAFFNLNVSGSNAIAATDSFELIIMNDDGSPRSWANECRLLY